VTEAEKQPSICFTTADFAGVVRNGGIGTHFQLMSELLAARGWDVTVLFCGGVDDEERLRAIPVELATKGIRFTTLAEHSPTPGAGVPHFGGGAPYMELSEHALGALEELHAEHHFDMIEFPDWRALGLRAIQAKQGGDALLDTRMAVKLHSTTQWQRAGNLENVSSPQELNTEFCEQYAFERADLQLSPSHYMLDYVRSLEWKVRDDAAVAYPFPAPAGGDTSPAGQGPVTELAFFGRLERRKGLHLFLDALDQVDPSMPVLFMGKDTMIEGRLATELVAERMGDRPFRIETEFDRDAALAELQGGERLAVIPSLSETFGFTVAECIANRIPFIAAHSGGIPEVVDHAVGRDAWLFEPSVEGLAQVLGDRLERGEQEESALREEVAAACDPERWNDGVEATYRELAGREIPRRVRASSPGPAVTVAISHFNHADFLPQALESIAKQTRPPDRVVVVDDGSTSAEALKVFAEQEALYPEWVFERGENQGPGAVRNRSLAEAETDYFLPFDSDNIATPRMIERLLDAMELNPSRAATTCHNLAFVEAADIEAEDFVFRYAPTGGPRIGACVDNVFGDTCALFRTEALRSVAGFEVHTWSPHEDWETFVKMAMAGLEIEVLPQPLFYYRTNVGGRLQTLTEDPAMAYRQRRYMIDRYFADAELTAHERRELWECVLSFGQASYHGVSAQLTEQQIWHESEMAALRAWGDERVEELRTHLTAAHEAERVAIRAWSDSQVEELRGFLTEQIEWERARAEAAERALQERPEALSGGHVANRRLTRARVRLQPYRRFARRAAGKGRRSARQLLAQILSAVGRGG
jgi:glycosyltransferase involved in cell wall biosynthesis